MADTLFTYITTPGIITALGEQVNQKILALTLNVNGVDTVIAVHELYDIDIDSEEIEDATEFYVCYQGVDYGFPIPEKNSQDYYQLLEILYAE